MTRPDVAKSGKTPSRLPSEQDILDYLRDAGHKVGKREIARAFNIRGDDRIALKRLLNDMKNKGLLDGGRKRMTQAGALPPVTVLDVIGPDDEGELIARPSVWDEEMQGPAPCVRILERAAKPGRPARLPGAGERVLARIRKPRKDSPCPYDATVMRRLDKRAAEILGVFRKDTRPAPPAGLSPDNLGGREGERAGATSNMRTHVRSMNAGWLEPVEKKARGVITVPAGMDGGARDGELVRAEIRRQRHRQSTAKVTERLGDVDDPRNISLIAIHEQGIRDTFPDAVLNEAENLPRWTQQGREDIRHLPLITIDPPDARDHDDAVWAAPDDDPKNPGGFQVIVAIADVAFYVRPGSAIDAEARRRGNSTYFPDRVVNMLPERLSTDLCSLKQGEDRPALACFMTFDQHGRKIRHRFARVVMRSAAFLSYEQAQAAIDGRADEQTEPLLEAVLKPLWAAHDALMEARAKRGPLELDIPERKLILDATGLIERVVSPERLAAHKLIEEMMIQANVCAAETLETKGTPFIYRVHDAPAAEKIAALADFLRTIGLSAPVGQVMKPMHFNRILARAKGTEFEHVVNQVVLRTQSQAVYSTENLGHFGLNLRRYAHFTSPIRRYADTIVHRALVAALGLGDGGLSDEDIKRMEETAEMISESERRSMAAERDTVDRMMAAHLSEQVGATFAARITGVTRAGLFVALLETGADGFIPISSLGRDYYELDEARHALIGQRSGESFQLGDAVEVRLEEAAPVAGGLRFTLLSSGKTMKRAKGGKGARRGKSPPRRKPRRR
ncbi:MAG TPA: ribonuclease R [Thermopetrobacter sp.]|nr:ribonuclease R [Thermopetrobacter sp.]